MFKAIQKRMSDEDRGFTLIELMVVVLIIAILIAIAIPTFLGARQRAQDRAAQSDLRNSLLAAEVFYVDNENYNAAVADLNAIEPELEFVLLADMVQGESHIGLVPAASEVLFVRESASGTYFCIAKNAATGTTYKSGTLAEVNTVALCSDASW